MERRYSILRQISLSEPIGRRTLSNILNISERIVRSETDFLKEEGLINVAGSGMSVTLEGQQLLDDLKDAMNDVDITIPVSKEFYDSVSRGTVLDDSFRMGSFIWKGSIGNWKITVSDKYIQ